MMTVSPDQEMVRPARPTVAATLCATLPDGACSR